MGVLDFKSEFEAKCLFFKGMKDAHKIKDQFKIGDPINRRELDPCLTLMHLYEAILPHIPTSKGLKWNELQQMRTVCIDRHFLQPRNPSL